MFGTYAPEEEEVCYGVTHPPRTWDPIFVNFQYWKQLWDYAVAAPYWWDQIKLWFMPLGWRPRGLRSDEIKPVGYTRKEQVKYRSKQFENISPYIAGQIVLGLAYMMITIDLSLAISFVHRIIMSGGIFMMIIAWGGLLQGKKWALSFEVIRLLYMGISLVIIFEHAGIVEWIGWVTIVTGLLVGISILYLSFFIKKNRLEEVTFAR